MKTIELRIPDRPPVMYEIAEGVKSVVVPMMQLDGNFGELVFMASGSATEASVEIWTLGGEKAVT